MQLVGELVNLRPSRARVYFELRDAAGAIPCAAWRDDWEAMLARGGGAPAEGMQVVVAGGCDYYPGSATSSPGFSFAVSDLRVAGEGDLLARIDRLRKQLDAEGLLEPPEAARAPAAAAHDRRDHGRERQGARRRARRARAAAAGRGGWCGRSRPCRTATRRPRSCARSATWRRSADVDVVIVARGGGSLADLLCFCDETLCRTVALLGVPVIASVGHHTDRTLLDDVAAVSCSTPTHAAEAAVRRRLRAARAREQARGRRARLREHGRRARARARARCCAHAARARPPRTSTASARACTSSCARSAPARAGGWRPSAR